ncbi:hypothetical protein Tco_1376044 [Tanacetum coccineum]
MVNTSAFLEANWHAKNKCIGHPQSKNPGKPLRKKAQQAFIQRRIKREKEERIGKIASVISGIRILGAWILDIVGSDLENMSESTRQLLNTFNETLGLLMQSVERKRCRRYYLQKYR